ncbi:hypothetical protein G7Y89_g7733 [Cudoniella acicularis]|uniref:Uncharacterized protein n=1 Tax=Cudoniella acicularis TaxID=354080 RepID=A0A8H4RJX9_9HELO|nr:hypothetical protein G7Y89_g7733 [Cudoniella acicularis]
MKTSFLIGALVASVFANPITSNPRSGLSIGPLPFNELEKQVSALKLTKRGEHSKRQVGGVKFCDQPGLTGNCIYTVYPVATHINPDPDWQGRIMSMEPDYRTQCYVFSTLDCSGSNIFVTAARDLPDGLAKNLRCFWCNPPCATKNME